MKNKKSERLTKDELKAFKAYVQSFHSLTDAKFDLGVSNIGMVTRAMNYGSAAPETVAKIRQKISV